MTLSRPRAFRSLFVLLAGTCIPVLASGALGAPDNTGADGGARQGIPTSVSYEGFALVRATARTLREQMTLDAMGQMASCRGGVGVPVDYILSPQSLAALRMTGIPHTVLNANIETLLRAERDEIARRASQRDLAWFNNYHPLAEIETYLAQLVATYPTMASSFNVGTSPGNDGVQYTMRGIAVSGPDTPQNPRANRPQLFFNACQHAREWISPATATFIADQLLEKYATDARVRALLDHVEFLIIPVSNPEGYVYTWTSERLWRKNRRNNGDGSRGVDLNRNWSYQWGLNSGSSPSTGNETYRGPSAFSEGETQRLRDFITASPRIRAHIDFHSYGQLILSPWSYALGVPPDNSAFAEMNPQIRQAILNVNLKQYTAGPGGSTLYLASGTAPDWTFGQRGIWGWTIELRDAGVEGFILPPDQIIPTGRENLAGVMVLGEYVAQPFRFSFPDGLPAAWPTATAQNIRVVASNNNNGEISPTGGRVYYRPASGGTFVSSVMVYDGSGQFTATIPGQACLEPIQYYFEVASTDGRVARYPSQAPVPGSVLSRATSGTEQNLFADDFETDRGWTYATAGDNATTGRWVRCDPEQNAAQPADDFSNPGTLAAFTDCRAGGSVGDFDIDNGTTTLTSPAINATPPEGFTASEIYVSYARWYSNDQGSAPGQDTMPVEISSNNGATWTALETVNENLNAWTVKTFRVSDFVTPTATLRVRFVARDLGSGSVVEAGVDDFRVFANGCPCRADFNNDGTSDFFDYLDFAAAFAAEDAAADFNGDSVVDFFDYLDFVAAFDEGCE
jgi:hypothetical protein